MQARLRLTRKQILAYRRRVGGLEERMPKGPESLRRAAWAGLQDSMPRAALLSLHARVEGVEPSTWEHPSLAQLWGPRYSTYVVPKQDFALFSLGRLPDNTTGRERAERTADRVHAYLDGARATDREVADALKIGNAIRYAATTGTVAIRWEGARAPTVWTVPAPKIDPADACRELARRYLHIFGPTTARSFGRWAGISARSAATAFDSLEGSLLPVRSPLGRRRAGAALDTPGVARRAPGRGRDPGNLEAGGPHGADRDVGAPLTSSARRRGSRSGHPAAAGPRTVDRGRLGVSERDPALEPFTTYRRR